MTLRGSAAALVSAVIMVACSAEASEPTVADQIQATTTSSVDTTTSSQLSTTTSTAATTTTTTLVPQDGLTAAERVLTLTETIVGDIAPKSVVANNHGLYFAQNMMYRHTVTVYNRDFELVKTIDDSVTPEDFGHPEFPGAYLGSPVEAAFDSEGRYAYVSNYRMYGGGLSEAASDGCNAGDWPDSFVYRIDTNSLEIDRLIRVGSVPKFLALTPNDRLLLVSNWCGFDVSVIDLTTGEELGRVPVGRHPRGIAIDPTSSTAYVAVMGSRDLAVIDLTTLETRYIENVGRSPRHLVISPDGSSLYITLNGDGQIAKLDLATETVVARVATGSAPRSMDISDDGTALYVVNYESDTMSKVRTSDMVELVEIPANDKPIGITYDAANRQVWVCSYSGTIKVFTETAP